MKRVVGVIKTVAVPLLVIGVSGFWWGKYSSREQARTAADEWIADGREVSIIWKPTAAEVQKEIERGYKEHEEKVNGWECQAVRERVKRCSANPSGRGCKDWEYATFFAGCGEIEIIESMVYQTMTKRGTLKTRSCSEEKETKQFVCKERKVADSVPATRSNPMPGKKWAAIKPTYKHFRY